MKNNTRTTNTLVKLLRSTKPMTASQLGWMVCELIKREKKPGGPYLVFNNPMKNSRANKMILAFIATQKRQLHTSIALSEQYAIILRNRYVKAQEVISNLPAPLSNQLLPILQKVRTSDNSGEIGLLSTLFYDTYFKDLPERDYADQAEQLDVTNILIWTSYTIFDTAVDEPSLDIAAKIPAANALLRATLGIFGQIKCTDLALSLLSVVDTAMVEEATNNSSNTVQLATLQQAMHKKSVAHVIGPLFLTQKLAPHQLVQVRTALSRYCAAKQLLDDLCDWRDDLSRNQYTFANTLIQKASTTAKRIKVRQALLKEVATIAAGSTDALNTALAKQQAPSTATNPFISATIGRITAASLHALFREKLELEAIASYSATRRST